MKKKTKSVLNTLPQEYLTALALYLPEMPFGGDTVFISNKLMGWDEINRRLRSYMENSTQNTGVIYKPVADGALLSMNFAMLVERIPLIEDALDIHGIAEELKNYPDLHRTVRNSEYSRLLHYLTETVRDGERNCRILFGGYASGGTGQYANVSGEHYPIFKLDANGIVRALVEFYSKHRCKAVICSLTGTTDITQYLRQYITGNPQARKTAIDALKARLYNDCVQAFEGNALMYTLIFN